MIGKAKCVSYPANSINYARKRLMAEEIDRYMVSGETGQEIAREFKIFQDLNTRCDNSTISVVLSPQIEESQKLNNEQLQEITRRFIEEMGLKDRQYIAYVHKEKQHKHIHLYVNRIDTQGNAYKDNYIGKKASKSAENIAKRLGMTTAMEVREQKQEKTKAIRKEIKQLSDEVLEMKPASIEAYVREINLRGKKKIVAEAYLNKQKEFQGVRFYVGEQKFKASEIHRTLGKKQLLKSIEYGKIGKAKSAGITRSPHKRDRGNERGFGIGL